MEQWLKSVISKIWSPLPLQCFFSCRKTHLCRRRSGPDGDIHIFNSHPAELYFEAYYWSQRHWHYPNSHQSGKYAPTLWGLFCSTLAKWRVASSQTHEYSGWMTVIPQSVETETLRSFDTYFMERRVLRKENYVVLSWSPQPALNRVGNHTGKDTAPCAKLCSPLHLPHPALVPVWLLTCQAVCNSSLRALLLLSLSPEGFQQEQMLVTQGFYRLCLKYLSPLFFQFVCHLFVKASIKH